MARAIVEPGVATNDKELFGFRTFLAGFGFGLAVSSGVFVPVVSDRYRYRPQLSQS